MDASRLPEHLRVSMTDRGFGHFPALPNQYGEAEDISVSVSESSNAEYAGIWLRVKGLGERQGERVEAAANLTAKTAWLLAEQLAILVANHYHGNQRPDASETILSVDLSALTRASGGEVTPPRENIFDDPELAAALEGIRSNPVAQTYQSGYAAGVAETLDSLGVWVRDRPWTVKSDVLDEIVRRVSGAAHR